MNNNQREYIIEQLETMYKELESVEDIAKKAELRGKYIELFMDMCTMSPADEDAEEISVPEYEDQDVEMEELEEVTEEPESVTSETEAILETDEPEIVEEQSNVKNASDVFDEDAEEVRVVLDENDEEVDITEIYNICRKAGLDEEDSDSVGLFVTQYECQKAYLEKFNYMEHGFPRAYAACLASQLTEQQLIAYIVDYAGLPLSSLEHSTDFINESNAELLFDYVYQD